MTARERVLVIKLLEREKKQPDYLERLGVRLKMNKCVEKRRENLVVEERRGQHV
jgi:hypothetical protein